MSLAIIEMSFCYSSIVCVLYKEMIASKYKGVKGKKGRVVLMHALKVCGWSRGIAPLISNPVSGYLHILATVTWERLPETHFVRMLCESQRQSVLEKSKIFWSGRD